MEQGQPRRHERQAGHQTDGQHAPPHPGAEPYLSLSPLSLSLSPSPLALSSTAPRCRALLVPHSGPTLAILWPAPSYSPYRGPLSAPSCPLLGSAPPRLSTSNLTSTLPSTAPQGLDAVTGPGRATGKHGGKTAAVNPLARLLAAVPKTVPVGLFGDQALPYWRYEAHQLLVTVRPEPLCGPLSRPLIKAPIKAPI